MNTVVKMGFYINGVIIIILTIILILVILINSLRLSARSLEQVNVWSRAAVAFLAPPWGEFGEWILMSGY